ncbi:MAG: alkaline phosphatase family protein, partial [Solirubrobacterales bacterium]|nr:alkaline phosphatase family protein [Solirubrobacterales bacterium]
MPAQLVLGPVLRHVGERDATVWVETDASAEVEVCGARERTFEVEGHHYALVCLGGLEPGSRHTYTVSLDGEQVWPLPGDPYPAAEIRTLGGDGPLRVSFGSCRVSVPHEPPYTLAKDQDERGRELDALFALALRMRAHPDGPRPDLLVLLGDQVYADEVSPGTCAFIRTRRDTSVPPGEEVADFEEYTHLYLDSWTDPAVRWLLSTLPTAMIFDDHDVHDDWNISRSWVADARGQGWWDARIVGGFMTYWIYQHIGNLPPDELHADEVFAAVRAAEGDAGPILREFAFRADREAAGARWSFYRDLGRTRLLVMDSRAGRVLEPGHRTMVDEGEWAWIEEHAAGDHDHLLLGTSLPAFLAPGMHALEAWNEAVCEGAWGRRAAGIGERIRRGLDLEHWAAFGSSFERLAGLLERVACGPQAPGSIVLLSGDVHHAYLSRVRFPGDDGRGSAVFQAVCSPLRNPLDARERRVIRVGCSR